jgi:hypothetical protein
MKRSIKIKPEGIMKLHEARRYVSQPSVEASNAEWWENQYYDYKINGGTLNFNDFKDLMLREGDIDYGTRRITPARYAAKDEKPPVYDSNKPITLQDYLKWGMTIGNLDEQSKDSIKFMLDKLKEQNK